MGSPGKPGFNISGRDILTSMAIRESFLRRRNAIIRRPTAKTIFLGVNIFILKTENLGNSGAEMYNQGRSRLVVLRPKV